MTTVKGSKSNEDELKSSGTITSHIILVRKRNNMKDEEMDESIVCRFCAKNKHNLSKLDNDTVERNKLQSLYEDLTKLQFSIVCSKYACTECLRRLRESVDFLIMLRSVDAFWRTKTVNCEAYINNSGAENIYTDNDGSDLSTDLDATLENVTLNPTFHRFNDLHKTGYACAHCGYSFGTKIHLIEHLQKIHADCVAANDAKPKCVPCRKTFKQASTCRIHFSLYHLHEKPFQCQLCDRIFATPHQLRLHGTVEHNGFRFQCTQCRKQFRHNQHFKQHINHHSATKSFICEACGKALKTKGSLDRHISTVHLKRPRNDGSKSTQIKTRIQHNKLHQCPIKQCCRSFTNLTSLQGHLKQKHPIHGIAEWQKYKRSACYRCNLKFDRVEQLEKHVLQHSELFQMFPCEICKNVYNSARALENHLAKHSKKPRPFICEICGASYVLQCHVEDHKLRSHKTCEGPITCKLCDYRCYSKIQLRNHFRKVHLHTDSKIREGHGKQIKTEPSSASNC